MNYRVENLQDATYQVLEEYQQHGRFFYEVVFQGSLSDCEAYIRLKQNPSVEF